MHNQEEGSRAPLLRRLPHNVEAEMALLGAIMVNNRAFERVSEYLRPEHFIIAENAATYAAAAQLIDSGRVADPVTLRSWASTDQHVSQAGGFDYLIKLADCAVTPINAAEYGKEIYDLAIRRNLIAIGEDIVNSAYAPEQGTEASALIEAAEQNLFDLSDKGGGSANDVHHISASLTEAFDLARAAIDCREAGVLPGISTGIADIDKLTNGLHSPELTVLAGRPSSGKTQTALNIARNVATAYRTKPGKNGKPERAAGGVVLFFSMEMAHHQLGASIQAPSTRVGSFALRGGSITREELFQAEVTATERVSKIPIYIDDRPALTVSAIRTQARRIKRKYGLHLIVIDYLQLMSPPNNLKNSNETQQITSITKGLKALCLEMKLPIIALSQLSRAVETRDDKRPQLSDLRSSGSIEQDADNVCFVYRDSYYAERAEPTQKASEKMEKFAERYADWKQRVENGRNQMELSYAKQRMGPIGNVKLFCDLAISYIGDLAQ